jgi:WD40 repeat protein
VYSLVHQREFLRLTPGWVESRSFSPDGRWLALGDLKEDGSHWKLRFFESATGAEVTVNDARDLGDFCFSPDSRWFAYTVTDDARPSLVLMSLPPEHGSGIESRGWSVVRCFSPDGNELAVGDDKGLYLLEVPSLTKRCRLTDEDAMFADVRFSEDGRTVAVLHLRLISSGVGPQGMTLLHRICDRRTGAVIEEYSDRPEILSPTYALRRANNDKRAMLIDITSGEAVGRWVYPEVPRTASVDGRVLLTETYQDYTPSRLRGWVARYIPSMQAQSGRIPKTVGVYDFTTRREIARLSRQSAGMFSPDGRLLATYDAPSQVIRIWDVPPRRSIGRMLACSLIPALLVGLLGGLWLRRRTS